MYGTVWYLGCWGSSLCGCSEDAATFRRRVPLLHSVLVSVLVLPLAMRYGYYGTITKWIGNL